MTYVINRAMMPMKTTLVLVREKTANNRREKHVLFPFI
jgi:hypothetical protein